MANVVAAPGSTISFGQRLAASATFDALFRDGMALVETAAAYLDGDGRECSQCLPRLGALAYASESMRLTTRLMQIAAWLLLQRAVNAGEMSAADAARDRGRSRAGWDISSVAARDEALLPPEFLALVAASHDLQARLLRLDALLHEPPATGAVPAPLAAQRALLRQAFAI